MNIVIIIYDDLTILLLWNIIKNNSNPSLSKSVTFAPWFGTWGPIADGFTVTTHSPTTVTPHSPTIVTTYTSHKNTKSPSLASLASGTNKIYRMSVPKQSTSRNVYELHVKEKEFISTIVNWRVAAKTLKHDWWNVKKWKLRWCGPQERIWRWPEARLPPGWPQAWELGE